MAEQGKITGQGFTMKVGNCVRGISGFEIKNKHTDWGRASGTKGFRVSGSLNEEGPWQSLVEATLSSFATFTFDEPVGVQFLRFDLLSYIGYKGRLQYLAPISAIQGKETTKCRKWMPQYYFLNIVIII